MVVLQASQILLIVGILLWCTFRLLFVFAIELNCRVNGIKNSNAYIALSFFFPLIVGAVCLFKQKNVQKNKEYKRSIAMLLLSLIALVAACAIMICAVNMNKTWLDSKGNKYFSDTDVTYYDDSGNTYNYNFEKHGYDFLYINGTEEKLIADLCYLDEDGMLYYDEKMDIVAENNTSCVDKNGKVYYPVRYSKINKDGKISYEQKSFHYDRQGNAYTYNYVPYYDKDGNKYGYSFDSVAQKGVYTNVITGDTFDNEYSFVDENGYFVYDYEHKLVKQSDSEYAYQYRDNNGNIYYWASGVTWDKRARLHDAYDKVIK